jgi:hypothetical protein
MEARFGDRLYYSGKDQKTFAVNFLSATPDGIVNDLTPEEQRLVGVDAYCVVLECKSADSRTNLAEAKEANVFQTQVQMGLVRDLSALTPSHSVLSYIDASFWSEVREFVIAFDERIYETAKERAMTIMTASSGADLKPEGWIAGGKECNYCPFTKACGIARRNLPFQDEPVDPQFAAEITDMVRDLKMLEAGRDGLDGEYRELQDAIKKRMRDKGIRKIPGVVSWSSVKGRGSYDNKAIREAASKAGIDVEQFQTIGEPTDRLTIQIGASTDDPMPGPAPAAA